MMWGEGLLIKLRKWGSVGGSTNGWRVFDGTVNRVRVGKNYYRIENGPPQASIIRPLIFSTGRVEK